MARLLLFLSFLFLALISPINCRVFSSGSDKNLTLISDGVHEKSHHEFDISLNQHFNISENACVHVYEFLPCAESFEGYLFQVFSFGCLLIIGEFFLTEGKTKLFDIFEVGFYGGIIFPLLTMFPRIALMLSTGLTGSREFANSMVGNNLGVTVGYTVFALTMQWGSCILFGMNWSIRGGAYHMSDEITFPRRGVYRSRLLKHIIQASVDADEKNKRAIGIMLMTFTLFVMVSFSEIFDSIVWRHFIVLITLIVSASATIFYFFNSYLDGKDQAKSLDHARFGLMSGHKHMQSSTSKGVIEDGNLTKESSKILFDKIDVNKNGFIDISELRNLKVEYGMMWRVKCDTNELADTLFLDRLFADTLSADTLFADVDESNDGMINEHVFHAGFSLWLKNYKSQLDDESRIENTEEDLKILKGVHRKERLVIKFLSLRTLIASIKVILGIVIVIFLAKPFMMNIELLSVSVGVPSFYVVFVVIPLARNLKDVLSAHFFPKKDKKSYTSGAFSEIYRDVTMNNLMGISIILAIVYFRGLEWHHSTEVLIVVVIGLIIGVPAYVRKSYPYWISVLAFSLYISSLVFIYVRFMPLQKN